MGCNISTTITYSSHWGGETTASLDKFRPKLDEEKVKSSLISGKLKAKHTHSAIAALTTLGFFPCAKIFDVACDSSTINQISISMEPFLFLLLSVFSITYCEYLWRVTASCGPSIRWKMDPQLAPIEWGISAVGSDGKKPRRIRFECSWCASSTTKWWRARSFLLSSTYIEEIVVNKRFNSLCNNK